MDDILLRTTLDFLLDDWLSVDELTTRERHAEHSRETFDAVLDLSMRVARERFAPLNRLVDEQEPRFDGTNVHLPAPVKEALTAYVETGLLAAGHDAEAGGMQLPYIIDMAANSFFAMASIGISAYAMLTYANCNLLLAHGTAAQRRAFARPLSQGRSFGTMCLSEPHAGSGLADITTRAVPDAAGGDAATDPLGPRYRLKGNKMWISGGEHSLSENIMHLVLAKIPGPDGRLPPGVKGISLFVVPRLMVDAQGCPTGERNDVALAGLNHKLGYRGTVNTLLNFGEGSFPVRAPGGLDGRGSGAIGYLVGEPGQGLACMFHMMNEARINVGMGATMLAFGGYAASLDYARHRRQGRDPQAKDPALPTVPIIEHTDVKRMLLAQKAYAEGGLALCLYCARLVDDMDTGQADAAEAAAALLSVLTPVAKSWPSEWGVEANSLAIQVLGGAGYTRDFPVEQHWRDNRLNMIHEGTHGIQALDLLGRKVPADDGVALTVLGKRIEATAARAAAIAQLADHARQLRQAWADLATASREAWDGADAGAALANATPYLQAFGHTVLAWMWLDVATVAVRDPDDDFLRGKLQATHYFFRYELPKAAAWLKPAATRDPTCREMRDTWF